MLRFCTACTLLLTVFAAPVRAENTPNVLENTVDASFSSSSLNDVLKTLAQRAKANLVVDNAGVEAAGVTLDQQSITIQLKGVSLQDALDTILKPRGLAYQYDADNSAVTITSAEASPLFAEIYSAVDFAAKRDPDTGDMQIDREALQELADLLTTAVEPDSWSAAGGRGNLAVVHQNASLVIRQSSAVHDQLRNTLDMLRRLADVQVVAELKVISVPASDLIGSNDPLLAPRTLPTAEHFAWTRGDHRWSDATVVEWANVTLQNGERFQTNDESTASSLSYRATVSESRTAVLLQVEDSASGASTTVSIPHGRITMIPLCKGRIPVIKDGRALVVVVAPHIKVPQEEEELLSGSP